MADMEMLKQRIDESGCKLGYLALNMGLSRAGLYKKLNGDCEFKVSEVLSISRLLHLSDADRDSIFFSTDVECSSAR